MKLFKKIFMVVALFFCFLTTANAVTCSGPDRGTGFGDTFNNIFREDLSDFVSDAYNVGNVAYKRGYVNWALQYDSSDFEYIYRDLRGNIITEEVLDIGEDYELFRVVANDDYLFVFTKLIVDPIDVEDASSQLIIPMNIYKIDETMEVVDSAKVDYDIAIDIMEGGFDNLSYKYLLYPNDEGIAIVGSSGPYILDEETLEIDELSTSDRTLRKYFPYMTLSEGYDNTTFIVYDKVDDKEIIIGYDQIKEFVFIDYYLDGEYIDSYSMDEYVEYSGDIDVKIIDEYAVVISEFCNGYDVIIIDIETGEEVQRINDSVKYGFIAVNSNTFAMFDGVPVTCNTRTEESCYRTNFNIYALPFNITTKTDGNGDVTVQEKSESNKEVTFVVKPKEGYVLDYVKVTDVEGNMITFTDYSFTMPTSDVTIEAVFKKDVLNPNTTDMAIISFVLLTILIGIVVIRNKKKLNWIK